MTPTPSQALPRWSRLAHPAVLLPLVFLAAAVPMILAGNMRGRGAYDQALFHEPTIRHFAQHWPHLCLYNYLSATTPLYHILLAALATYVSDEALVLRCATCLITVGLLATFAGALTRCAGKPRVAGESEGWVRAEAFAAGLPLVCSMYVLSSGIWLQPDNLGWWGVLGVLLVSMAPRWSTGRALAGGLILALLVLARQSHLWAAAPLWAAAWVSVEAAAPGARSGTLFPRSAGEFAARAGRTAIAGAATIPAFLIVAWFAREWGGLVVPRYQKMYTGVSPSAPAFILANLGVISGFFVAYLWGPLLSLWREKPWLIAAVLAGGLLLAAIPDTSYNFEHGRSSGLWGVVQRVPLIAGRTSPVMLVLGAIGACALAGWLNGLSGAQRWVAAATIAGFAATQAASSQVWQRYTEPMLLLLVPLWALSVRSGAEPAPLERTARLAGPVALAVLLAGISCWTFVTAVTGPPEESDQYVSPAELDRTNVHP